MIYCSVDLSVGKRHGTSSLVEIYFTVLSLISSISFYETQQSRLAK